MQILFLTLLVLLLVILILGIYDNACLDRIIKPMSSIEFNKFYEGTDCSTSLRFCGSIYLWHRKYKHTTRIKKYKTEINMQNDTKENLILYTGILIITTTILLFCYNTIESLRQYSKGQHEQQQMIEYRAWKKMTEDKHKLTYEEWFYGVKCKE